MESVSIHRSRQALALLGECHGGTSLQIRLTEEQLPHTMALAGPRPPTDSVPKGLRQLMGPRGRNLVSTAPSGPPSRRPLKPGSRSGPASGPRGVRDQGAEAEPLRRLACWPFLDPRTPPGFAETPVFASFGARPCSTGTLSVFHRLDRPSRPRQGRGVRKRPSDRLQRRPSRGPLSPLVGDTY